MVKKKFGGTTLSNDELGFRSVLPKTAEKGEKAPNAIIAPKKKVSKVQKRQQDTRNILMGDADDDDDDEDDDHVNGDYDEREEEPETPPPAKAPKAAAKKEPKEATKKEAKETPQPASSKKDAKEDRKKQQKARSNDLDMLEAEQQEAMKQRIIQRLLRALFIGFFLEMGQGDSSDSSGAKKKKSKGSTVSSTVSSLSKVDLFGGPCLMLMTTIAMFAMQFQGEGYSSIAQDPEEANFYDVLGIERGAEASEIKKLYKKLAVTWHPDKNPNCAECEEKFSQISKAYDTLGNPAKRKAYDEQKSQGSLTSGTSTTLTGENFEPLVLRSNEVWYVAVFDPNDYGASEYFASVWEDAALTHRHEMRFGRIDLSQDRRPAALLPQRVLVTPVVWRFARGLPPMDFNPNAGQSEDGDGERDSGLFHRFLAEAYPAMPQVTTASELTSWRSAAEARPQLMLVGKMTRAKKLEMKLRHLAHTWGEFVSFTVVDPKAAKEVLKKEVKSGNHLLLNFDARASVKESSTPIDDIKEAPEIIEKAVAQLVSTRVPFLNIRNYNQLCSSHGARSAVRVYCLVLVDATDDVAERAATELTASHANYKQELADLEAADKEATDEPFLIQAVRVNTSPSRWPQEPTAATGAFHSVWAAAGNGPWFVLETATHRIAGGRSSSFKEIYQQVAYDDLKFTALSEGTPLGLPDPEETLLAEVRHAFASIVNTVLALLVFAGAAAVLPELSFSSIIMVTATSGLLLMIVWAPAFRHAMMLVSAARPRIW